jgi:hypothetical protein
MKTNYSISIPKPCHENWNAMTNEEKGKFCAVCSKSVIDFTLMKEQEVHDFIIEHKTQKICGRFRNEQITSNFKLNIPRSAIFQKRSFSKAFLLSLFIVMGTSLFSCKNKNNQTLGEVAIVDDSIPSLTNDSIQKEDFMVGESTIDTTKPKGVKPPKPKIENIKFIKKVEKQITMGMVLPKIIVDSSKVK